MTARVLIYQMRVRAWRVMDYLGRFIRSEKD